MCGICGALRTGLGDRPLPNLGPMLAAMAHRGPNGQGDIATGSAVLGMTRLAVLDTSPRGQQPMANAEGTLFIVYNGEMYNFPEQRARLEREGHSFSTGTDTEVVLRLYEIHGADFLRELRGMFALAILDLRAGPGRERLLLARDPLGIKPLLYANSDGTLIFASEMKSLLASGRVDRTLDHEAMRMLLTLGSIPQPRTAVRGVRMLPPGFMLLAQGGTQRQECFWNLCLDRVPGLRQADYVEQTAQVRVGLEESVRLQLLSDVPVGAFLSGGVDSAIIVAIMARQAQHRVKTFSVGFGPEGGHLDETDDALRVARHVGTDHHRIEIDGVMVRDNIQGIVAGLDQPTIDGVNSFFVSMAARREVTVALSGTGGDELFCGYPWFSNMALWAAAHKEANAEPDHGALSADFDLAALGPEADRLEQLRANAGFLPRFAREYFIFTTRETARLLHPEVRRQVRAGRDPSLDHPLSGKLPAWSPVARVSALCLRGYTQNQLLRDIDAVSMAHSLEVRVPYLDTHLVDLALSLPDETKLGSAALLKSPGPQTYRRLGIKRILIDSCRDLLPEGIDDQVKRGFAMPFDAWLKGPLREVLHDALSPEAVRTRGLFDPSEVAALLHRFELGQTTWPFPWMLMATELWCREVLDGAAGRA